MNKIELIRNQISHIGKLEKSVFLDSVILHLERAEHYYELGQDDNYYYNDLIYRTNQAFEGALKEAFKILAEKSSSEAIKETPYKIEKYFEDNGIFKERVLELFRNYRNEWRNKATHDYKLFFDNNEAFIAITSVSSFTLLLLNQIIEKISFESQKKKVQQATENDFRWKEGLKIAHGTFDRMTLLLSEIIDYSDIQKKELLESELTGLLKANFNWFLQDSAIYEQAKIGKNLRPDFLVQFGNDKVILEVKMVSKKLDIEGLLSQVLTYLQYSQIKQGIVLALNINKDFKRMSIVERVVENDNTKYIIRFITNNQ